MSLSLKKRQTNKQTKGIQAMSRFITQKYADSQVEEIDAMYKELWDTSPKFRAYITAKDNLEANYRYTKSFVLNAIDGDGISNDTRVHVNYARTRFIFKDWTGTITNVKRERKIREAHLRKSFPKLGADL
jgi:hypothetical protein|tara:strand:- start:90 stop:479 length:390 start_codon:yes stop_codon:yes gene_type:complete